MAHPTLCVGGPLHGQVVDRKGLSFYGTTPDPDTREQHLYRLQKVCEKPADPSARSWLVFVHGHVPAYEAVALAIHRSMPPLGNPYAIAE